MVIKNIGLIGAGTTGQGIARDAAASRFNVKVLEISPAKGEEAIREIAEDMDHEISRWGMTETEKKVILSRIEVVEGPQDLKDIDLIVEAVPESLRAKSRVLKQMDQICPPEVIFASNTSTLSITELGATLDRPDRTIGLHFHHPVPKTKLVEVIRGLKTSDETFEKAAEFVKRLGKTPIDVFEYPGYVTTRAIIPYLNEAMYIVMEGVASAEDVDRAMCLGYNLDRGPLTLADHMGLDEVMSWMEHLFRELGDVKYRPCPLLRKLVRAGHLGVKTGQGFFRYDEQGQRIEPKDD
jgi:3-hydroxybutyryl-CoA dehydrogenase